MNAYLIIDIGTGNVRVALVDTSGHILWVGQDNVIYHKGEKYKDSLYFEPDFLWEQIIQLARQGLLENPDVRLVAATASSQREGIVLIDKNGKAMTGFPNHDHRGRFMEDIIKDKNTVYTLTGRYPTSLFSALKLVAYCEEYPKEWERLGCMMSISDWAQYQLSGVKGYEHAQASETLLYDVRQKEWSEKLFSIFGLTAAIVPPLQFSGTASGQITKEVALQLGLKQTVPVIVGGADTQLAVKSTHPDLHDIVIVSGTTTPVTKITTEYVLDKQQRSWTNSYLDKKQYMLETNCGVTGLNYQRIKSIFYPNETYDTIEQELDKIESPSCFAHLGAYLADEKKFYTKGGFQFDVPVMTALSRADFVFASLWEIACAINENLSCLMNIHSFDKDYVWCCG
ncbi:MAG: FGGY family carbohydrate kinase, partial [Chitinophagaceae bacterium]